MKKEFQFICEACGHPNNVNVEMERKNKAGMGACYSSQIKVLGNMHREVLVILKNAKATTRETGLTRKTLGQQLNSFREVRGEHYVHVGSLIGRLSELRGLGIVNMAYGKVDLKDSDQMKFRQRKTPVWYLDKEMNQP